MSQAATELIDLLPIILKNTNNPIHKFLTLLILNNHSTKNLSTHVQQIEALLVLQSK